MSTAHKLTLWRLIFLYYLLYLLYGEQYTTISSLTHSELVSEWERLIIYGLFQLPTNKKISQREFCTILKFYNNFLWRESHYFHMCALCDNTIYKLLIYLWLMNSLSSNALNQIITSATFNFKYKNYLMLSLSLAFPHIY